MQALAQTDTYLRKLGVVKEAVDDTAGAAQMVARQQLQVRQPASNGRCIASSILEASETNVKVSRQQSVSRLAAMLQIGARSS
jgi:prephenate dehydratase